MLLNGHDGGIIDAYTVSDRYPYSQDIDGINYIRNSVKAVVDAYDGSTTLYVADPEDPVIQTWEKIFPAMFKPMAAMSDDLRAHIRYPEYFFQAQAAIYRTYHMKDPQVFYNREDQWDVAKENYCRYDLVRCSPFGYTTMACCRGDQRGEDPDAPGWCPSGRDNMIAWMACASRTAPTTGICLNRS